MSLEQITRLRVTERSEFARCSACGQWYDKRIRDELLKHLDHQGLAAMLTLDECCPACLKPMEFIPS
jgi:hypothetical protein